MAVLSFEEYKKQAQEGKKPESLYVSDQAINREAGAENVPAETVPVESPQKTGIKTWTSGGNTYVTDRSTGKTTQTFNALDYFLGGGSLGEDMREQEKLADMAKARDTGKEIKHESLSTDLGQMFRGTVENIGASFTSAAATLANAAGAIAAGDNNYEPEEDSFIWKLVESAEGKTGYAESNLENAKEGRGAVGRFAMDIGSAGLELALDQALNFVIPGSGLAAMGVRSFGRKSEASREAGETVSSQVIKGAIAAATAAATERMSEIGGLKTGKPGYIDRAWDGIYNALESKTGSKILGRIVTGFGSEALEEIVESITNPIAQRIAGAVGLLGGDEADAFESIGQIAYEGLVGGTLGALGAVGNVEYNGAQEIGETATPNITADELAKSCEHATNLAIDQHLAKAEAQANEQAALVNGTSSIDDILRKGRVSNITANAIIDNQGLSAQFEDITGIQLDGTREENRRAIQRAAREYAYNAQMSDAAAQEAAVQAETEETIRTSGYGAYIRGVLKDGATVSDARDIIRNPEMRATWEQMTGKTLPETPQSTPARLVMDTAENLTGIPGPVQRKGQGNNAPLQQNIDNGGTTAYNNNRITNGGAEDGIRTAGLQQDDAGRSAEANRRGIPGVYQYSNSDNSGWGRSGEVPVGTGFVLISENARKRLNERGVAVVEARDASSDKAAFSSALESARANDPDNGWAVTPKSAEELEQSGARLLMDERGSAGLAVTPDGDIEAVFANHAAGAPKGATKSLIPMAIANGGTKLDCYGIDLVKLYAQYGFTPVARVKFDPEYANPGWDSSKGTPDIYFVMHNGDSADSVVDKIGTYPIPTAEELQALPEMDYDSAYAYRDRLLAERSGKGSPQGGASAATPQSATQTAPIAEEPLRAATQGRPYSQPEQMNTPQEAQTQAAGSAQNAQRATPQAETPPTTQNAAQAASGALNLQDGTNAQEPETTAAQNAAPAAYNQTTGQWEQPEGANAVRGFSENVVTDSAMETALREDIAKNPDLYKRLSNKDTLKKAQDIFSQGLDAARSELERAIGAAQSGQKLAPEMVPLSRMVANELTRRGELDAARKIISDVAAELTSAGQLGQAGAILRNADPMTVLNTLQKSIDQINAEMAKKFGKRNQWTAELTAEEIKQISETDFSQDGAFEAIQQQIAERREMPATLLEKLREIRKIGMLANPKTQVKNVAGNAPLAGERKIAEKLSGGLQELAVKAGIMSKDEQTRTLRVSKESKDLAKNVYENNLDRINRKGNKGELHGILKDTRTYFNKGLLQKGIEKATGHQLNDAALDYVRRFTYDCLEKGDAPFVKSAFIDSLAQYCEAQGIQSEADVTETAFSYALDQAMAATFKDASALANLLNSIKDKAGIAGEALDVLFPFTTTPINIGKEFAKYSPLGYLQLLNAKGKSAAEVIDIVSRATTGSAVVALGILLRSLGAITGAADDDKDKAAADKAAGISPYSILGKYSYEWMQPTGSELAMGASIYDAAKDGSSLIETLSNGIISAGDAYLEQSFYKDIIDLFKGYGSPTENMIKEVLTGTASQFIPTIVGATARTIDPTVRTSYTGGNIIDDIFAQAKVKTPGLSKSAPASVNVRGEEVQRGNLGERIWDNFIAPWNTNRNGKTTNAVDKALDEVYEATGDKTIFRQVSPYKVDYGGESYQMTGEEREQFQKTQGQVHDDILQQIIDGGQWKNLSNGEKVKIMQRVNEYALDSAKRELVESRGNKYSSDWDDEAEMPDVGDYLAAKTTLKAAQDSKDYTLLDALVDTVTEQKKDLQEKLNKDFSMLDELIYGKQRGVDAKTIYTAKTEADTNGNGKISQEELWYYLGLQKNMPEDTKDVLWDILTTGKTGYAQYAEKQK